jgi:hypothetical protein
MNIEEAQEDVIKYSTLSKKRVIKGHIKSIIVPRKFQAYCVGTAKSGTHSVADIFNIDFRSAHEPDSEQLIYLKGQLDRGEINTSQVLDFLKKRDVRNYLHMESSDFGGYFFQEFMNISPKAKFILPIRDCYSFIDSIINHQINNPVTDNSIWKLGRDINYGNSRNNFPEEEKILASYEGLYSIKGYLHYWVQRNKQVLNLVNSNKLFALKTGAIKQEIPSICRFLNIPKESVNIKSSHSFKAPKKYNLIAQINPDYIDQLVVETGGKDIMTDFYPELSNVLDARL